MVTIDEFKNIELVIAQIKEAADHPDADRLYVLKVDIGDQEKQIVAGIKKSYQKEDLIGKYVIVVNNLDPVTLRGVESSGMLLAASDDDGVVILSPERPINPGTRVK